MCCYKPINGTLPKLQVDRIHEEDASAIDIDVFVAVEENRDVEIGEDAQIYNKLVFDFVNEELRRVAYSKSVVGISNRRLHLASATDADVQHHLEQAMWTSHNNAIDWNSTSAHQEASINMQV